MTDKSIPSSEALALCEAWGAPLYAFIRGQLRDDADAEDVTQEALITILRKAYQISDPSKQRAWAYKVARRAVLQHHRKRRIYQNALETAARQRSISEPPAPMGRRDLRDRLRHALSELPGELREVLELRYLHGLTQVEASEALELPRSTLRRRLDRGLSRLRESASLAGCAVLVPELEATLGSLGVAEIPAGVAKALRASILNKAPALQGSALTAGGVLVKLKTTALVLALTALGFGSGALLTQGTNVPKNPTTPVSEQNPPLLQAQNRNLSARLEASEKKRQEQTASLREQLSERDAQHQEQVAQLKASIKREAIPHTPVPEAPVTKTSTEDELRLALVSMTILLDELGAAGFNDIKLRNLRAAEKKQLMSNAMILAQEPVKTVRAALDLLRENYGKQHADFLTNTFHQHLRLIGQEDAEAIHQASIAFAADESIAVEVRSSIITNLINNVTPSEHTLEGLEALSQNPSGPIQSAALIALTTTKIPKARRILAEAINDPKRDSKTKDYLIRFIPIDASPESQSQLVGFFANQDPQVRRWAYKRGQYTPLSRATQTALEQRILEESSLEALDTLSDALGSQGDARTVALLDSITHDEAASLERRSAAKKAADAIQQRLDTPKEK